MASERTGVEKLRGQLNMHLHHLRNGPVSRQEQIQLCRTVADLQDQIDQRNAEAKCRALERKLEKEQHVS